MDYSKNANSLEAQQAWADEADSLGLRFPGVPQPFLAGCDGCRERRNKVREARETWRKAAKTPGLTFHLAEGGPVTFDPGVFAAGSFTPNAFYIYRDTGEDETVAELPFTDEELERRFTHHRPDASAAEKHGWVRELFLDFANDLNSDLAGMAGREASLAMTKLEEASFWAHAAIARSGK